MLIKKILIKNFRSIASAEIEPNELNVFVGQNNHGKTNIFAAIEWFFGGKGDLDEIKCRTGSGDIEVEMTFIGVQEGLRKMKNERNRASIVNKVGDSDEVRILRTSSENPKNRRIWINDGWEINPTGLDTALNDLLPFVEFVHTKISLNDYVKYGKATPVTEMLSGVLSAILESSPKYAAFRSKFSELFEAEDSEVRLKLDELSGEVKVYLERQFPDCEKVVFEVGSPLFEDLLKNFITQVDDGVLTSVEEKGDGMQRALMLAIIQTYADFRMRDGDSGRIKNFLFFIDEGELHLHPSAQRRLKSAMADLARRGDQIFFNTHSSVLIADDIDDQLIFKVEKIRKETQVSTVFQPDKSGVVYELLGGSPNDLLLPRNFLIVEGRSEYEFLEAIRRRFYPELRNFQIIWAKGDVSSQEKIMYAIHRAYVPIGVASPIYKDKVIFLCDKPNSENQSGHDVFREKYPDIREGERLFILAEDALEKYYPGPHKLDGEQVKKLGQDGKKIEYAKQVGETIKQEEFEKDMPIAWAALKACSSLAYS
jgi:putative ATP-dependent endonuclease of OLD family